MSDLIYIALMWLPELIITLVGVYTVHDVISNIH